MAATINPIFILMACITSFFIPTILYAQEIPPPAYQIAAQQAGVPSEVLYAVALTESGFGIKDYLIPWPWTLNIAGKGHFFKTQDDACAALTETLKTVPAKRVDIGLGQINFGYHGNRVSAPCDLLDPYLNLSIAADILKTQYRDNEDWIMAMGRYHSPAGGEHAKRYRHIASRHLTRITTSTQ